MQHGHAGGKDAPVHDIGKGLLLRKAEARPRRRQLSMRDLLACNRGGQCNGHAENYDCDCGSCGVFTQSGPKLLGI